VDSGILTIGRGVISCSYKGQTAMGHLAEDGSIEYQGVCAHASGQGRAGKRRTFAPGEGHQKGWRHTLLCNIAVC
jgi:hypothetical protein